LRGRGEEGNKASLLRYSYTAVWVHSLTVQLILQKVCVMMGCACDDCYGENKNHPPAGRPFDADDQLCPCLAIGIPIITRETYGP
jgi:hypothetical protein